MSYPPASYHGTGEASARLTVNNTPPNLTYNNKVEVRYLASGDSTRGQFGLYRWTFGPTRSGPDPHFHRSISESFFILDGEVELYDGRRWRMAHAGDFLFVPEGGVHGFRGVEPASMLLLFAPGAPREEYFETLAKAAEQPMSDEERAAFMDRHDTYWV
ncbi:MAG TPA: cupin domain-containing protein [Propionibacteriaceae bacterium]|nr:cupin domain-containing protein [Propionibacteriaceae bacterium]